MCFCRRKNSKASKLSAAVRAKLESVPDIYPDTTAVLVVAVADGSLLAERQWNATLDDGEARMVICSLRTAARQFAQTMGAQDVGTMHIRGSKFVYSCYVVGKDYVLAFYTPVKEGRMSESPEQDAQIEELCEHIRLTIDQFQYAAS